MSYLEQIDPANVPQHIAIIMDGNGRWAKKQGNIRLIGHKFGVSSVRTTTEAAAQAGVKYLTLYAFSTENWSRPRAEVEGLMKLLTSTIASETESLIKNNVRLRVIGNGQLPQAVADKLLQCQHATADNTGLTLTLAISYSARWEITEATRKIATAAAAGHINPADITDQTIQNNLTTTDMPDPELLIRTSGEYRISNFLLWQIAYAELYFTDTLWPDFTKEDLYKAIVDYQHRERRFGLTSEQLKK